MNNFDQGPPRVEMHKHSVTILEADSKEKLTNQINEYLATPGWVIVNNSFSVNAVPSSLVYTIMMLYTETEIREL